MPEAAGEIATYVFNEVIEAIYSAQRRLKKLSLNGVPLTVLRQQSELWTKLGATISNLEELEWNFYGEDVEANSVSFPKQVLHGAREGRLEDMLKACTKLRSMTINPPLTWREPEKMLDLSHVVGSGHWSMLNHLDLTEIKTTAADLVRFLLLHKETLTYLRLDEIRLIAGTWIECFEPLASQLRHLERLFIYRLKSLETEGYILFDLPPIVEKRSSGKIGDLLEYLKVGGAVVPMEEVFADDELGDFDSDSDDVDEDEDEEDGDEDEDDGGDEELDDDTFW